MKRFFLTIIILPFLLVNKSGLQAQTAQNQQKQVSLDNTEQFSIESKYVKGENYLIQVGLPIAYKHSDKSYPVLYVLDGDKSFGMTKEITDWLTWDKEIKDLIVVGISYGKGSEAWWNKRARDFTQFKDTVYYYYPNAGGANNFLSFIKTRVLKNK